MRHQRTTTYQRLVRLGVSLALLISVQGSADATPGYRVAESAPSGVELPREMTAYHPAVLSISFRQNLELPLPEPEPAPDADALFAALQQQSPENRQPEPHGESTLTVALRQPVEPISTPEPGTIALLGLGIIALAIQRWKRKQA